MNPINTVHSTAENLQVLYEDNHLIIVNKRCGDIVQGDKTGDIPLSEVVKAYIKNKYQKPGAVFLGVVHRLDRPTSGIVLFARTSKALERMNAQFKNRETQKTYWAVVNGHLDQPIQTLQHYLVRNEKSNTSKAHLKEVPASKLASLSYRTLGQGDKFTWVEIDLHTGRHHQIRSQFSAIGHPIKGDLKYGAARSNPNGGIDLHARKLVFQHPVTKEQIEVVATPPAGLWDKLGR